jgi:hypothetical protein
MHGIAGAFSGAGSKTVIPHKVAGKFSIRLVAGQEPAEIESMVGDMHFYVNHITTQHVCKSKSSHMFIAYTCHTMLCRTYCFLQVVEHCKQIFGGLGSSNELRVTMGSAGKTHSPPPFKLSTLSTHPPACE